MVVVLFSNSKGVTFFFFGLVWFGLAQSKRRGCWLWPSWSWWRWWWFNEVIIKLKLLVLFAQKRNTKWLFSFLHNYFVSLVTIHLYYTYSLLPANSILLLISCYSIGIICFFFFKVFQKCEIIGKYAFSLVALHVLLPFHVRIELISFFIKKAYLF